MATLMSKATGNFTASATWGLCDATAELDSEAANQASATAYAASASFAPGAIQVSGVAVKVVSRSASPTGTMTVDLYNATTTTSVANVVVNVTDVPLRGGWFLVSFTPITLVAGNNYQVRFLTSTANQVTLYRNATLANLSRQLRTTAATAPSAGDKLIVAGEHTGAGTGNDLTVTMDSTTTTSYGSLAYPQSLSVTRRGTLQYGVASSTAYYLKVKGLMRVNEGGTFTMGTSSTPIPSTSTADLEFDATAGADSGLEVVAGTFRSGGASLATSRTTLAADAAAAATTLTTAVSTGWLSGDNIGIFPTKRVGGESELRQLSANATGTSVPVSVGLTYAHDGTGNNAGEVVNLSRNVRVRGASQTLTGYYRATNEATTDCSWTEFRWLGHTSTAGKRGLTLSHTTPGTASLVNCAMHSYASGNSVGVYQDTAATTGITLTNCSVFQAGYISVYFGTGCTSFPSSYSVSGLWAAGGSSYGLYSTTTDISISDCRLSASNYCLYLNFGGGSATPKLNGVTNIISRSGTGIALTNVAYGAMSNITAYRSSGVGVTLGGCDSVTIDTLVSEGATNGGLQLGGCRRCTISGVSLNSGAGFNTAYGVYAAGLNEKCVIASGSVGTSVAHTSGDVVFTGDQTASLDFQGCTFGSPTELSLNGLYAYGVQYSAQRYQGVAGSHKVVRWEGSMRRDTIIVDVAPSSVRLTPSRTTHKLKGTPITASVQSGQSGSVSVQVRKSVAGDGTAYNGAQPRLVVLSNPSAGITYDTVLATASGAAGSWETLSGTTAAVTEDCVLEYVVDCDGTQGWVNYDTPNLSSYSILGESWAFGAPFMTGSSLDLANFTDVPTSKVELGYGYKYNSIANNRTGTRRQPATTDVKTGILYGPSDSLTGSYDGSDRWTDPGIANVRSGVQYKANSTSNNRTGDVTIPAASQVKIGIQYDTLNSVTGTYDGSDRWTDPGESVVLENIQYKANSLTNNKTGTLDLSSVATATAAAVWNTDLSSYTTANTAGLLLRTALTQIINLISLSWIRRR